MGKTLIFLSIILIQNIFETNKKHAFEMIVQFLRVEWPTFTTKYPASMNAQLIRNLKQIKVMRRTMNKFRSYKSLY